MKLTEKQKRFADEYVRTGNATESARLAGYKQPHVQGAQNLEKLSVKTYIDCLLAKMDKERIMCAEEAMKLLTEIARGEMEETVYLSSPTGIAEVTKKPDINQRKDALKEILKRNPLYDSDLARYEKARADKMEAEVERIRRATEERYDGDETVVTGFYFDRGAVEGET